MTRTRVQNRPDLVKDRRSGAVIKTSAAFREAKQAKDQQKQIKRQQQRIDELEAKMNALLNHIEDNNGSD